MRRKVLVSWSSGKDSAWTLYVLQQDPNIDVVGLFCTVNQMFERVTMHGVRVDLLKQQAQSTNIPLHMISIPHPCDHREYIKAMTSFFLEIKKMGVECLAFGDLFLKNVREYRENLLKDTGITPIFPLWGISTKMLSRQMIAAGLKAVITCIDPKRIPMTFAGREYDESFLHDIPEDVDPCGEYGEFHSFAFEGPIFQYPIKINLGETIYRKGLYFTDVL